MKGNFKTKSRLNLLGQRFGNLVVTDCAGSNGKKSIWMVECDCGSITVKVGNELKRGKVKTCSKQCQFFRSKLSEAHTTHGLSHHPIFHVWKSLFERCRNPKCKAYKNYGGRGINVCSRWESFETFILDMGAGYSNKLSLDRIDNNQGYCPENCRWVSMKENSRNRRGNRNIDTPLGKMLLSEAAEISGIGVTTLGYRLQHNWPVDKLFLPADFTNRIADSGLTKRSP